MELFQLVNRVAVITGAAGGFGAAIASILSNAGATVILVDIDAERTEALATEIQTRGKTATAACLDVTDPLAVASLAEQLVDEFPTIDILINNAGISPASHLLHEIPLSDWDDVISTNLTSVFLCTRALMPHLLKAGGASVINISSIIGTSATDPRTLSQAGYAAAKAGVIALTKQTAADYGASGLRANAVVPGWHSGTRLGDRAGNFSNPVDQERLDRVIDTRTPLRRQGTPEELAALVLYLASDASTFVTGAVIHHDGGWSAV